MRQGKHSRVHLIETAFCLCKPTTTLTTHHTEAKEQRGRAPESTAAVTSQLGSNEDHVHEYVWVVHVKGGFALCLMRIRVFPHPKDRGSAHPEPARYGQKRRRPAGINDLSEACHLFSLCQRAFVSCTPILPSLSTNEGTKSSCKGSRSKEPVLHAVRIRLHETYAGLLRQWTITNAQRMGVVWSTHCTTWPIHLPHEALADHELLHGQIVRLRRWKLS